MPPPGSLACGWPWGGFGPGKDTRLPGGLAVAAAKTHLSPKNRCQAPAFAGALTKRHSCQSSLLTQRQQLLPLRSRLGCSHAGPRGSWRDTSPQDTRGAACARWPTFTNTPKVSIVRTLALALALAQLPLPRAWSLLLRRLAVIFCGCNDPRARRHPDCLAKGC